ncbi:hypothetical protein LSCM1_05647 [Leishmania martiniquensis]|uniref:Uncharacterized protein n=1 Tax=Leishmania martiniquensis TaxID=1580590 RepID=A0A836H9A5_9TRYP|nr:hypothetical protein LSCM1_05647 [Leishmania martiniquensis]
MTNTEVDVSSALPRSRESVAEHAVEGPFVYAHVQRTNRKAAVDAHRPAEMAGLFHPEVWPLAKHRSARRTPFYSVTVPVCVPSVQPDEALAMKSSPRALPSCWRAFLDRASQWERQRIARLQTLRLQVVEGAVKECTFHSHLSPDACSCRTCGCSKSRAESHITCPSATKERKKRSAPPCIEPLVAALAMFEGEMEELRETLRHLYHVCALPTYVSYGSDLMVRYQAMRIASAFLGRS